jgi:hypothetical protein
VPFARYGARFTRDFEDLVTWLVTKTDRTAVCRLTRIDWLTVGRVIKRVGDELLDGDRLSDLFVISLETVSSYCTSCNGFLAFDVGFGSSLRSTLGRPPRSCR